MVGPDNLTPPTRRLETTRLQAADRNEAMRTARIEFRRLFPASAIDVRSAVKIG